MLLRLVSCLVAVYVVGCGITTNPPQSCSALPTNTVSDPLTSHDSTRWQYANWANGDPFLNGWCEEQISQGDAGTSITLTEAACQGRTHASGEYRTSDLYSYGYYQARIRASDVPGTVTGFFTYIGPSDSQPHDEIDIEIKGQDPTRMQVNYWTNGVEHPTLIELGFDASECEHDYAFDWQSDSIRWYVDGALVHTEDGSNGALPTTPGRLTLNYWACVGIDSWCGSYQSSTNSSVQFSQVNIVNP